MNACANHVTRSGELHRHDAPADAAPKVPGQTLQLKVRPCSRTRAERIARHQAREGGFRIHRIVGFVDQGPDAGWLVTVLVSPAGHASRRKAVARG